MIAKKFGMPVLGIGTEAKDNVIHVARTIKDGKYSNNIRNVNNSTSTNKNVDENNSYLFGEFWHADQQYLHERATLTMLYSNIYDCNGGDTLIADSVQAYLDLDENIKNIIDDGYCILNRDLVSTHFKNSTTIMKKVNSERYFRKKPIVNRFFNNGELIKSLNIGQMSTDTIKCNYDNDNITSIKNFKDDDINNDQLLNYLLIHQILPKYIYHVKWEKNMVLLFDNRLVNHKSTPSYYNGDIDNENYIYRSLYRILINTDDDEYDLAFADVYNYDIKNYTIEMLIELLENNNSKNDFNDINNKIHKLVILNKNFKLGMKN